MNANLFSPWILVVALAAGCAPDAGNLEDVSCGNRCGPATAGGASGGLATGPTGGGTADRSAGRSGSLSEGVVLADVDASGSGNSYAGLECGDCEDYCGEAIGLCMDDVWGGCACADLCYYSCLAGVGDCYDDEDLAWLIDEARTGVEESGIVCP